MLFCGTSWQVINPRGTHAQSHVQINAITACFTLHKQWLSCVSPGAPLPSDHHFASGQHLLGHTMEALFCCFLGVLPFRPHWTFLSSILETHETCFLLWYYLLCKYTYNFIKWRHCTFLVMTFKCFIKPVCELKHCHALYNIVLNDFTTFVPEFSCL